MSFGFCLGKKPPEDVLILHKIKSPKALARLAKERGTSPKTLFGTLSTEGKVLTLHCLVTPPPGVARRVRLLLKQAKLRFAIQVIDPDGQLTEQDAPEEDDQDGDGGEEPPTQAAVGAEEVEDVETGSGPGGSDGATAEEVAALRAEVVALGRQHRANLGPEDASRLSSTLKAADAARDGQRLDEALALLWALKDDLEALADQPSAEENQDGPTASEVAAARAALVAVAEKKRRYLTADLRATMSSRLKEADGLTRRGKTGEALEVLADLAAELDDLEPPADLLPLWQETRQELDRQIALMRKALMSYGHPDLKNIADYGFNALTGGRNTALMAALFDYRASPGETEAAAVRQAIARYEDLLADGSVLDDYDSNPLGVAVAFRQTLSRGLDALRAGLGAA